MHISLPIENTMEYINATELSPLISKCQVKVCYVGQEPNRNGTVITKKVATEMGRKIPGSPVVGFYNEDKKDFEGHNREVKINDGKFQIVDTTRPYGFVPTDAKVWFQKFSDDGIEHEYLCTECFIWTSAYPESKRIIDNGNSQSMELSKENNDGFWANNDNSGKRFFIYNEALIEKLCILGEDVEPCFEGAQFKDKFSLEEELSRLNTQLFSMMDQLQNSLKEGGSQELMEKDKEKTTPTEEDKKEKEKDTKPAEEKKEEDKDGKKKYNLEEVVEYQQLKSEHETLKNDYSALQQEKQDLEAEVTALREFKLAAEHQSKQTMIDSFYMLSDDDKKDVVENMDTYSLDEIEAKLSVICVRNKVDFNLKNEDDPNTSKEEEKPNGTFNLSDAAAGSDNVPAWIKAVRAVSANK